MALDRTVVDENVSGIFPGDEAIALRVVEPLDSALFACTHCDTFHNNPEFRSGRNHVRGCDLVRNPECLRFAGMDGGIGDSVIIIHGVCRKGKGEKARKIKKFGKNKRFTGILGVT